MTNTIRNIIEECMNYTAEEVNVQDIISEATNYDLTLEEEEALYNYIAEAIGLGDDLVTNENRGTLVQIGLIKSEDGLKIEVEENGAVFYKRGKRIAKFESLKNAIGYLKEQKTINAKASEMSTEAKKVIQKLTDLANEIAQENNPFELGKLCQRVMEQLYDLLYLPPVEREEIRQIGYGITYLAEKRAGKWG